MQVDERESEPGGREPRAGAQREAVGEDPGAVATHLPRAQVYERITPVRRTTLTRAPKSPTLPQALALAAGETEPTGDIHADAAYRRETAGTLVYRALQTAFERVPEPRS